MNAVSLIMARASASAALLTTRTTTTSTSSNTRTMIDLLIVLMVLLFLSLLAVLGLFALRKIRRRRALNSQLLPQYSEKPLANHRLTISTSPYGRNSSIYVYDEKNSMSKEALSPPLSPENVPEIRITFPDEQDESGRRKSGRVVVVRVGEHGVALEPLDDEQLPAYEKENGARFQSIDMERIGGLKEKF